MANLTEQMREAAADCPHRRRVWNLVYYSVKPRFEAGHVFKPFIHDELTDDKGALHYVGNDGVSQDCYDALKRFVQFGDRIQAVRLLTAGSNHAFRLDIGQVGTVFVRSGFTSGYSGEGPKTLAQALMLIELVAPETIDEIEVDQGVMRRLNQACLTTRDLRVMHRSPVVRPMRIHDYIYPYREGRSTRQALCSFPVVMPWAIIDCRLIDIALTFESDPDRAIFSAFRVLEDVVRQRTNSRENGVRLFSQAFAAETGPLHWGRQDPAEEKGMMQLFVGTYMAYRNPRAHRSPETRSGSSLAEFLLVNHLFILERQAVDREITVDSVAE